MYDNGVVFTFDVLDTPREGEDTSDLIVWGTTFENGQTRELTMNAQEAVDVIAGLAKCVQKLLGDGAPLVAQTPPKRSRG